MVVVEMRQNQNHVVKLWGGGRWGCAANALQSNQGAFSSCTAHAVGVPSFRLGQIIVWHVFLSRQTAKEPSKM